MINIVQDSGVKQLNRHGCSEQTDEDKKNKVHAQAKAMACHNVYEMDWVPSTPLHHHQEPSTADYPGEPSLFAHVSVSSLLLNRFDK
jgi:hypothetical protein